jgi:PAS domain S-box-containing protein
VSATLRASAVVSGVDETPVEAHLRRVLDTQPVPLSRVSADGLFLAVNDAALSMLGAERLDQVLDTSLLDMVAPESRESCRVFLSRVAAGDRGSTEVDFTGLGGLAHTLQVHGTTHPVSPDGTSSVLATFRDVTEYRRLEHAVVEAAAGEEQRAAAHAAEVARLSTQIADSHANATARSGDEARTAALEQQLADAERKHHEAAERHAVLQAQARAEVQAAQEQLEATIAEHLSRLTKVEGTLRTAEARERNMAEQHEADSGALRLALQQTQDDYARQVDELRKAVVTLETTLAAARTHEHDLAAAHSRNEAEWRRSLDEANATHERNTSELRATIGSLEQSLLAAQDRPEDEARTVALEQQLADAERTHHEAAERHAVLHAQAQAEAQAAQKQLEAAIAGHRSRLTELEDALRTAEARERTMAEQHAADAGALRLALQQAQDDYARQLEELRTAVVTLETTLAAARTHEHDLAAAHSRNEAEWRRSLDEAIATHERNTSELRATIGSLEQSLLEAQDRSADEARIAALEQQLADAERTHHDAAERHAVLQAQAQAEAQAAQAQLEATIAGQRSRLTDVEGALRAAEARERTTAEQHAADSGALRLALQQAQDDYARQVDELRTTVVSLETTLTAARTHEHDLAAAHSRNEAEWRRSLDEAIATHERNTSELRTAIDGLEQSLAEAQDREQRAASTHQASQSEWQRQADQAAAAHQQQVGELRAAIAGLETSVSALTQEFVTAVADRNAVLSKHKEALQSLDALARERDAALAASEEEKRALAAEHERARAEWEREHQQARAHWDREHQQLQAKWAAEHAAALATWNAEQDVLTKHRAELRARIASVESERDELNSQLVMVGHERLAWSARLDHAERLARAGRLSLSFADDIGTALEGVADHGRLLLGDAGQGHHRERLDQMLAAAVAAQALVRQLRQGARTVDVDPLEISPVIHSLERTLAGLLSPDITLRILAGAEGARVRLTSQQLEQVALTLAANRRAVMVKGGQVTIELAEVDIDEACARERMASPGPYVLLAVHAAGPEVEHGTAPQLFGVPANEDTWQTAGPGMSGLFAMVNDWGGCLWASKEGPDALAFEIYLPRVMAERDTSPSGAQR